MSEGNHQYVTHGEFTQFAAQTNGRFDEVISELTKLRDSRSTNWGVIFAGVGVLSMFIALYVTPVREAVVGMNSRLGDIETSRFTPEDGENLQSQISTMRNDHSGELISRARWMGNAENDIRENKHELDLIWNWRHEVVDPAVSRYDERIKALETELNNVRQEQASRTSRVYAAEAPN